MKIINCDQGSFEWWEARRGVPTASCFDRIITPKTEKLATGRSSYIAELIGEMAGHQDDFTTRAIQQGIDLEPEARKLYEFDTGVDVKQVGFCLSDCGRYGCSPDGLVGDDGGIELKCPKAKTHVQYLLDGVLPTEYRAQVHGCLLVTGRKWWDFMSYCHNLPPFRIRVEPDGFTDLLWTAIQQFVDELDAAVSRIDELGGITPEVITDDIVW